MKHISIGLIVTLLVPYSDINPDSALVEMFAYVGADRCKIIVAVGALAGLTVSMLGSMVIKIFSIKLFVSNINVIVISCFLKFPMPRVVYGMFVFYFLKIISIAPKTII
jgi:hypothetical protein